MSPVKQGSSKKEAKKEVLFETAKRWEELRSESRVVTVGDPPGTSQSGEVFDVPMLTFVVEHRRPKRAGDSQRHNAAQQGYDPDLGDEDSTAAIIAAHTAAGSSNSSAQVNGPRRNISVTSTFGDGRRRLGNFGRWLSLSGRRRTEPPMGEGGRSDNVGEAESVGLGRLSRLRGFFALGGTTPRRGAPATAWQDVGND